MIDDQAWNATDLEKQLEQKEKNAPEHQQHPQSGVTNLLSITLSSLYCP